MGDECKDRVNSHAFYRVDSYPKHKRDCELHGEANGE
eukprot:CAMPEP_0204909390 /NCGR_PEP_ID=MMETSP1397-20131031/8126_1 /ASSEMBLY_ACC=CAM_ASM_000891 /TAXON_ID=49980 /ORGANISM="Climacostomum Climacostomum virens, Strain Stock W-24" /LENGTH=36 /DNA_ID= /DNA_START= /DNA_END= /DNA_ORIENTATION=